MGKPKKLPNSQTPCDSSDRESLRKLPTRVGRLALLLGPLVAMDAKALAGVSNIAVAAENEATARAALQILEQGGTAVDAAIAAARCSV